jgi:hypothetical protein
MTRLAVGPEWERLSEARRQQVSQAFERYIAAIYADRFDTYSGEKLQVTSEAPSAGGTMITTEIVKSTGEPVNINYLVHQNGGAWQIADVYLNGTISELGDTPLGIRLDPPHAGDRRPDRNAQHQGGCTRRPCVVRAPVTLRYPTAALGVPAIYQRACP